MDSLYRAVLIFRAKLLGLPLCLSDSGDLDGIASAALFKMKYPRGVVVLAAPAEVKRSWLIRSVCWDFVADLPCPGRAKVRADHHETNTPCAEKEFYDPDAPAAAVLALEALGLRGNPRAERLVKYAVETDTARIVSDEAKHLDYAIRGASYPDKLYLVNLLASRPIEKVLTDNRVSSCIARGRSRISRAEEIANSIPVSRSVAIVFRRDIGIAYRHMCIVLERRGVEFVVAIVPKGVNKVRLYVGARRDSPFNACNLARLFGGGGHQYAAGATVHTLRRKAVIERVLDAAKQLAGGELAIYYV